jgi:hypothetical protein
LGAALRGPIGSSVKFVANSPRDFFNILLSILE